jgi:hypothetical protein
MEETPLEAVAEGGDTSRGVVDGGDTSRGGCGWRRHFYRRSWMEETPLEAVADGGDTSRGGREWRRHL